MKINAKISAAFRELRKRRVAEKELQRRLDDSNRTVVRIIAELGVEKRHRVEAENEACKANDKLDRIARGKLRRVDTNPKFLCCSVEIDKEFTRQIYGGGLEVALEHACEMIRREFLQGKWR